MHLSIFAGAWWRYGGRTRRLSLIDRKACSWRSSGRSLATGERATTGKAEAKLNAFPQFVTTIDWLDIHFIHVRSRHPNALPLIITRGWPGSVFEMVKIIGPLTDPTANGGKAEDAFDVVVPSMPGYGFSGRPKTTGWNADHIARAWA
jgi:pimeloyl-ACP methyl ester carboxylesterase